MTRTRLDARLAERAGCSRTKAAAMILAGQVTVDGQAARKAGQSVGADSVITWSDGPPPVSRAGGKLEPVLDDWKLTVTGLTALDCGASTGGFTEVLLRRGAGKVYAVDTGHGQLAWTLRNDLRVVSLERTDIRALQSLPDPVDVAVVDCSFISLRQVLPAVARLIRPGGPIIALFKPQFEVGKSVADRFAGVISDETVVEEAIREFRRWLQKERWRVRASAVAAVAGAKGNRERLFWLEAPPL